MLTKTQCPYTGPYSVDGYGKHKGNTALALKRAMARLGHMTWEPEKWDNQFNVKLEAALDKFMPNRDGYGEKRYDKLRGAKNSKGEYALDAVARKLIRDEFNAMKPLVPALGPVYNGGRTVLQHDCTHLTDGIPLYPAFDDAFASGTGILAPEDLTVVSPTTSSRPGEAFYALGVSKVKYWFGHLDRAQPIGRKFEKGDFMGRVIATNIGGGSHCHVGVNVEGLWGQGRQLAHHSNYTHGAPLIGDQFRAYVEL